MDPPPLPSPLRIETENGEGDRPRVSGGRTSGEICLNETERTGARTSSPPSWLDPFTPIRPHQRVGGATIVDPSTNVGPLPSQP